MKKTDEILTFLFAVFFTLLLIYRALNRNEPPPRCNNGMILEEKPRAVSWTADEGSWLTITGEDGDVDVVPEGEEHTPGANCICEPHVDIVGARLVRVHNAFDHREIVEQAVAYLNGNELE